MSVRHHEAKRRSADWWNSSSSHRLLTMMVVMIDPRITEATSAQPPGDAAQQDECRSALRSRAD